MRTLLKHSSLVPLLLAAAAFADIKPLTISAHSGSVMCVTFSPDGATLVSSSRDHTVKLWNPKTGKLLHTIPAHTADVYCVTCSPQADLLATCSGDKTIRIWDAK